MKFEVASEMQYDVIAPTTFIFNIQVTRSAHQEIMKEELVLGEGASAEEFTSISGDARFLRVQVSQPGPFSIQYRAKVDLNYKIIDYKKKFSATPLAKLDSEVLPYLFPSRYCQSDKLQRLATKEFGHIENDYQKVVAISEWINENVEYLSGSTNSSTSAFDTLTERAGVCRDFAHLGIALCRALSIPARYFTGYAYKLNPPDFHACFEAYIGGQWVFFDPTQLVPPNGMVKIANGRDAADAAVASIFGHVHLRHMEVSCEFVGKSFKAINSRSQKSKGVSYQ